MIGQSSADPSPWFRPNSRMWPGSAKRLCANWSGRDCRRSVRPPSRPSRNRSASRAAKCCGALHALQAEGTVMAGRFGAGRRARMVRAPSARPHPPLHARPATPRDRTRRAAGLPALSVRMAAPYRRHARGRGRTPWPRCWPSSRASRHRRHPGSPSCCQRASVTTRAVWLDDLCTSGRIVWTRLRRARERPQRVAAARRARRRRCCCCRDAVPALVAVGAAARRDGASAKHARGASSSTWPRMAHRFSTRSPTARTCSAAELEAALAEP